MVYPHFDHNKHDCGWFVDMVSGKKFQIKNGDWCLQTNCYGQTTRSRQPASKNQPNDKQTIHMKGK